MAEFPIQIRVKSRKYGVERSINVLDDDSSEKFTDTQDWRLKKLQISSTLREQLDIDSTSETEIIGYIKIDPETFEWEFVHEAGGRSV
jgi:hypothetical protein